MKTQILTGKCQMYYVLLQHPCLINAEFSFTPVNHNKTLFRPNLSAITSQSMYDFPKITHSVTLKCSQTLWKYIHNITSVHYAIIMTHFFIICKYFFVFSVFFLFFLFLWSLLHIDETVQPYLFVFVKMYIQALYEYSWPNCYRCHSENIGIYWQYHTCVLWFL